MTRDKCNITWCYILQNKCWALGAWFLVGLHIEICHFPFMICRHVIKKNLAFIAIQYKILWNLYQKVVYSLSAAVFITLPCTCFIYIYLTNSCLIQNIQRRRKRASVALVIVESSTLLTQIILQIFFLALRKSGPWEKKPFRMISGK